MNKRVVLVDDHAMVRAGIRAVLQSMAGFEIVAEAEDGAAAIAAVTEHRPDLVLMDVSMKGMNGLEAARRMHNEWPQLKIIIMSMHASEDYVAQALQAGASAYLLKESAPGELEHALTAIARSETYLDRHISRQALENYRARVGADGDTRDILTARQREILQLIAEGNGTKEIAYRLGLSAKTVETHRAQIMERLDIHDVPGLVRYAIRMGLATPDR